MLFLVVSRLSTVTVVPKIELSDFWAPEAKSRQAPMGSHMGIDLAVSGFIGP